MLKLKNLNSMHDSEVNITWEHVVAHSDILENEADLIAINAAKRLTQKDKDLEHSCGITPSGPTGK